MMRKDWITFGGVDLRCFNCYTAGPGVCDQPELLQEEYTVPGRNGVVLGASRRLPNIDITFPAYIPCNFQANFEKLKNFLLYAPKIGDDFNVEAGYVRLTNSLQPDKFRWAVHKGGIRPTTYRYNGSGKFDLTFHCRPEIWRLDGQRWLSFTGGEMITNPTYMEARPDMRIHIDPNVDLDVGASVTIGASAIVIKKVPDNSEHAADFSGRWLTVSAYNETEGTTESLAPYTSLTDGTRLGFTLKGMESQPVNLSGVTELELRPNWWEA